MTINKVIPILTTQAGSCLTAQNWQEAGVQCVSYYLSFLMVKPGLAYLKVMPDWKHYSGWEGDWVLNATMSRPNAEGYYTFRSPFDGAKMRCTMNDIIDVILQLKPQQVILPEGFEVFDDEVWHKLASTTKLYALVSERDRYLNRAIHGLYYNVKNAQDITAMIAKHQVEYPELDYFFLGSATEAMGSSLESDQPAIDACSGIVYCVEGEIDLKDKIYATQFECIDSACGCPTCKQQFTRAYLHHLLEHTPLLCQRYLIQHNVSYLSSS